MKNSLLALGLLAALPFAASAADDVSYNYVEAGYIATDVDGGDADGWSIRGAGAIAPNFHLFGEFANQELDGTNFDYDQWRAGVGYNHTLSPRLDLLTRVAYERLDAGSGLDFDAWSVEAGVRGNLARNFEGYALAGYEDGDEFDGDFYGRVGALVKFNPTWGLSGDVKFVGGDAQWFIGPRATF